jgi:hypothetical protein
VFFTAAKMDSESETTAPELSETLVEFVTTHSVEELYAFIKDLDKVCILIKIPLHLLSF